MGRPLCESCQDSRCAECDLYADGILSTEEGDEGLCCCTIDEAPKVERQRAMKAIRDAVQSGGSDG